MLLYYQTRNESNRFPCSARVCWNWQRNAHRCFIAYYARLRQRYNVLAELKSYLLLLRASVVLLPARKRYINIGNTLCTLQIFRNSFIHEEKTKAILNYFIMSLLQTRVGSLRWICLINLELARHMIPLNAFLLFITCMFKKIDIPRGTLVQFRGES